MNVHDSMQSSSYIAHIRSPADPQKGSPLLPAGDPPNSRVAKNNNESDRHFSLIIITLNNNDRMIQVIHTRAPHQPSQPRRRIGFA